MTALDIIRAHATALSSHNGGHAADVCDALGVDVDEGTSVGYMDAAVLALTLHAVAAELATMRERMKEAQDVPPVTLRDATEVWHTRTISPERYDDLADDAREMERADRDEREAA